MMIMTIMILMLLLVHAEDNDGDDGNCDDGCSLFSCYLFDAPITKVSHFVNSSMNARLKHNTIVTVFGTILQKDTL